MFVFMVLMYYVFSNIVNKIKGVGNIIYQKSIYLEIDVVCFVILYYKVFCIYFI